MNKLLIFLFFLVFFIQAKDNNGQSYNTYMCPQDNREVLVEQVEAKEFIPVVVELDMDYTPEHILEKKYGKNNDTITKQKNLFKTGTSS